MKIKEELEKIQEFIDGNIYISLMDCPDKYLKQLLVAFIKNINCCSEQFFKLSQVYRLCYNEDLIVDSLEITGWSELPNFGDVVMFNDVELVISHEQTGADIEIGETVSVCKGCYFYAGDDRNCLKIKDTIMCAPPLVNPLTYIFKLKPKCNDEELSKNEE